MNPIYDVDAERDAWHDVQADTMRREELTTYHRCPIDMPPCPDCQELDDDESFCG